MATSKLEQARAEYAAGYYGDKLEEGLRFEDFVAGVLHRRGIILVSLHSRYSQYNIGENLLGAEIKRDSKYPETDNLYIEIAEKAHPDNKFYVPSGIYRNDNSWLYIIGDEACFWIFATRWLRRLHKTGRYVEPPPKPTACGFKLPLSDANKYCCRRIVVPATERATT